MTDFQHLLDPYVEYNENNEPLRTLRGQMEWLIKNKGIDSNIAQLAMAHVYFELSGGLKFESDDQHSAGHYLDRYLLDTANNLRNAAYDEQVKAAGNILEMTINQALYESRKHAKIEEVQEIESEIPQTRWEKIKRFFLQPVI